MNEKTVTVLWCTSFIEAWNDCRERRYGGGNQDRTVEQSFCRAASPAFRLATGITDGLCASWIIQPSKHLVPLIFMDTLYHFPQTTDLAERAARHYDAPMHVYRPPGTDTVLEFEQKWGPQLWERDEDTYDYLVKVEPARRAYEELAVRAAFTGRRRSQGADRASLQAVEVDETGLIKVNPLMNWSFGEVDSYVKANAVPYNELLDMGYKSIGDWHSTSLPSGNAGDDERSGRWKDKAGKTECGLHKDYFKMKKVAEKKLREAELARKDEAKDKVEIIAAQPDAEGVAQPIVAPQ